MVYDFVFIVLVYKNTTDLRDFLSSFIIPNSKIVIVNSFFDNESKIEFEKLALKYGADFLNIPNKGYGFGNNRGCGYAIENYKFRFLIISNPDIVINLLDISKLENKDEYIIAPDIINLHKKRQNPFLFFCFPLIDKIKYWGYKKRSKIIYYLGCIYSRLLKIIFYFLFFLGVKGHFIYSSHGSFVIIGEKPLRKLFPIYNEKMFLFVEEEHLAMLAQSKGVKIFYEPEIKILHKEDGSMSSENLNYNEIVRSSFIEFYNYWYISK